ncbi:hypothetical protein [Bacillus cereus group sp. BfR-BA-01349]|uniref:hypothetical protein n=1 Tax=Bacillus cereus group sp. BfR-BA-01349 TaxID=2920312 RepID=UPI001F57B954
MKKYIAMGIIVAGLLLGENNHASAFVPNSSQEKWIDLKDRIVLSEARQDKCTLFSWKGELTPEYKTHQFTLNKYNSVTLLFKKGVDSLITLYDDTGNVVDKYEYSEKPYLVRMEPSKTYYFKITPKNEGVTLPFKYEVLLEVSR